MAKPRSKLQRQLDRESVARLALKGWSQTEICQFLEVDQSTISRDLKAIQEEWLKSSIRNFDLDRQRELEKLRLLEKEHWLAWERSQLPKESNAINSLPAREGSMRIATKTEHRVGDATFLAGILRIIDTRARLLGLSLPQKEIVPHDDHSIDFSRMSVEELRLIASGEA